MTDEVLKVGDRVRNAWSAWMFGGRVGTITVTQDDPRLASSQQPLVGVLFDGMEEDHSPLGVSIAVETLTKIAAGGAE